MSRFNFGDQPGFNKPRAPAGGGSGNYNSNSSDPPNPYALNPRDRLAHRLAERERAASAESEEQDSRTLPVPPSRSAARERRGVQQFDGYGNGAYEGAGPPPVGAANTQNANPYAVDLSRGSGYESINSGTTSNYDENPYAHSNPYAARIGGQDSRYDKPSSPTREPSREPVYEPVKDVSHEPERERERERELPRPIGLERGSAKRRSDGTGWTQRSPTRKSTNAHGDGSQQIEEVLRVIKGDWSFMTEEKCIPVQVALQFMDDSSLGLARKYGRFRELHEQLQAALRQIVNEQHQGFNSSIGRFHAIQAALTASQIKIRELKQSMNSAKRSLESTRPELKGLAKSSQNYDDMLMVLHSIEQLQGVPEKLEAFISEKRFLSAVETLQQALKSIKKQGMEDIGALSNLRVYLSNQEHSLMDILIEELHNHLYLKSPYCENRWKQHATNHVRGLPKQTSNSINVRPLYQFLDQLDTDSIMTDDPIENPEINTFSYIRLIVESLNSLGRLDTAVESIAQRLPVELFRVVEKCSSEIDQRYPASLLAGKDFTNPLFDFTSTNSPRSVILNDLFGTIFARFEAIGEGHRVVHEVISGITRRDGTKGSNALTGGFRELWKLYQSEIRSLFHDYLATDDAAIKRRDDGSRGVSVFDRNYRNKTKKIFALRDMDSKATDIFNEKESLQSILKSSVPGLVSDSKTKDGTTIPAAASNNNSIIASDGSATGHKLLVEPSVFNMAILLPPSLAFLNRLKEVVPSSSDIAMSTLTSFLDDFLINVFLPQLDETVVDMCARTFMEADAFTQDAQWQLYAKRPIFKGTARFYRLIEAFCRMLDILPHDQAFSQLIVTQIVTYYDKCCEWFKSMLVRSQSTSQSAKTPKLAALLLEDGALKQMVNDLLDSVGTDTLNLINTENASLINMIKTMKLQEADLILDRRSLAAFCLLHTSTKWLANKTKQLRYISTQATDIAKRHSGRFDKQRRWTLITAEKQAEPDEVFLPLTTETAVAFDGVHRSYEDFSAEVLRLLHVEIRGHVMYYIQKSMARTFLLDQELNVPDPEVVTLNADLAGFDEELSVHLQPTQQTFITSGLASLVDAYILSLVPNITAMNIAGCSRQQLNILVLQQNLKNIESDAQLTRSALYFDMFSSGPDAIITEAKSKGKDLGFSYDEMRALLQLCYSENSRSDRREIAVAAERGLEERQLELSEFLW